MDVEKTYIHKVYSGSTFLGLLPKVKNDFRLTEEINSGASELAIEVGVSPDSADEEVEAIQDETGDPILDENNDPILEERRPSIVGPTGSNALIANNNTIKVYEISSDNPNGLLVFHGWITTWEAEYGGGDSILVTCLSKGVDLKEYVLSAGESVLASQTTEDTTVTGAYWGCAFAQMIQPTGELSLDKIKLKLSASSGSVIVTPILCSGNPDNDSMVTIGGRFEYTFGAGNAQIASFSSATVNNSTATEYTFSLTSTQNLLSGENYYIVFMFDQGEAGDLVIQARTDDPSSPIYRMYYGRVVANNTGTGMDYDSTRRAMYIKLISSTGNTTSAYSLQDPTNIFESALDNYLGQGGQVNYVEADNDLTALSVSYTFITTTILDVIKKCLELAPSDFFWRVSPGSLQAYFSRASTTADHTFVKGQHINKLNLSATVDDVVNKVIFSGGDTGAGENLLNQYINSDSLSEQGRQRFKLITDNRVTSADTSAILADNVLDENADEVYRSPVIIPSSKYNISSINVGDMVGFAGFGSDVDNLLLQVARLIRHPNFIELTLGKKPPRETAKTAQALKEILLLKTINDPTAPS